MSESRRDFQEEWEGWKAGILAFHAFHSLSFPTLDRTMEYSRLFVGDLTNPKRYIHGHEKVFSNGLVRVGCSARRSPLR